MEFIEKTVESDIKYDGRVVRVFRDTVLLPDGNISHREVVKHNGGVCVVAVTNDDKIIMERQYRYAMKKYLFELPAGKLEKGEESRSAGIRELREETGAVAETFDYLGEMYPTPGYDNEIIYFYLAKGLIFGEKQLDLGEYVEVEFWDIKELLKMIKNGEIKDAKTVFGLTLYAINNNLLKF